MILMAIPLLRLRYVDVVSRSMLVCVKMTYPDVIIRNTCACRWQGSSSLYSPRYLLPAQEHPFPESAGAQGSHDLFFPSWVGTRSVIRRVTSRDGRDIHAGPRQSALDRDSHGNAYASRELNQTLIMATRIPHTPRRSVEQTS